MRTQGIAVRHDIGPQGIHQPLPAHHGGIRLHQHLQDGCCCGMQLQATLVVTQQTHAWFQRISAHPQRGPDVARGHMRSQRAQARQQFRRFERLDHPVDAAGIESGQLVVQCIARGEEDHRHLQLPFPLDLATQCHAVHARQVDVEHADIERGGIQHMAGLARIAGEVHVQPVRLQVVAKPGGDVRIVLDQQHAQAHAAPPLSSRPQAARPPWPGIAAATPRPASIAWRR